MEQKSRRNHYIPQFFSKLWIGADGKLCEYCRPRHNLVMRRKPTKAVGYADDLYLLPGAVPEDETFIEDRFFARWDQRACDAMRCMLAKERPSLSNEQRSAFTRFLLSLLHRSPHRIAKLKENMGVELEAVIERICHEFRTGVRPWIPGLDLERFASEWRAETQQFGWGKLLMQLVDSNLTGPVIFDMRWAVRRLPRTAIELLTSDHPLIHSNGISHSQGHIALPLGPRALFLASTSEATQTAILSQDDDKIALDTNRESLRHARHYVYATDDRFGTYVDTRLPRLEGCTR